MLIRILRKANRSLCAVEAVFSNIASGIIMLMMFLTTADVMGRYLFNSPIQGAYEVSEMMLVGIVFLGLAYVQSMKGHVKVDVATSWLPQRAQMALDILGYTLALFIMAVITWRSGLIAWQAWVKHDRTMGLIHFPLWPGRSLVSIGMGLYCLRLISNIIEDSAHMLREVTK